MRRLAQELNLALVVTGNAIENNNFWDNINAVKATGDIFDGVKLVVLPSYVEHQPRVLLKAIALGIPVITTKACGLVPGENLTIIPEGDYEALKNAVQKAICVVV